jgi:PAS domain S-box-containing protein
MLGLMERSFLMIEKKSSFSILLGILLLFGLYLTSLNNYLLFHSLAEIFSIVVACAIFMLVWNARRFLDNTYLLFIGIAYLFIGGLDLIHTLAYKGMGVFQGDSTNLPTQLWITARYVESLSLLIAPFFLGRKLRLNFVFLGYLLATSLLLGSIFYWNIFPICFVEGVGLTLFKKISEYIISLILLGSIAMLCAKHGQFDASVLRLLITSIFLTIASEFAFTFYAHAYGLFNLIGHYLKIISFYLIYKALIETGLARPYALIFRDLKQSEEALRESEEKYRSMMEGMKDPVYICSPDYSVTYMNPAMIQRTGADLTGEPCYKVIHEREEQCPWCVHEKIQRGDHAETTVVSPKDGRSYHVSHSPLFHADGSISKMTIFRDITELKRAEEALQKARDKLEQRVEERTAELSKSNVLLKQEITDRKRTQEVLKQDEARLEALLRLTQISEASPNEIANFALDQGIKLTGSGIGFLGFLSEDESVFTLHAVSKNVMQECKVVGNPVQWHIAEAGIWANAIKQRKTLFVDDYAKPHPTKKGLPEGHFPIQRLMVVPVFEGNKIIAVAGVGNKPSYYDKADERQLTLLMNGMWHYTQRKKAEEALYRSEAELRLLSSQLLKAQEKERKRIARELHDGIGQSLSATKFSVENSLKQIGDSKAGANVETLKSVSPLIQESIEEVRKIAMDLRPSTLDDLGILATINWFCREFQTIYSGIRIEKQIKIQEDEVPDALKTVIYRVLQEGLNNVAKHSEADLVRLSLRKTNKTIEMAIEDNGLGFDLDEVLSVENSRRGLGLASMKERAELSGGSFAIQSIKGTGSTIRASWPDKGIKSTS